MKRRAIEQRLTALVEDLPAAIRQAGIPPNACILAARLGVEALRAYGVRGRALAVELDIFNATYRRLVEEWAAEQTDHAAMPSPEQEEAWGQQGAKRLVAGRSRAGGIGHVVVIADERYLLELTGGQFHRPEGGIAAQAFWFEVRELARGEVVALASEDGALWRYEPHPEDREFLKAPAWSAYRISRKGRWIYSERTGPAVDAPVAAEVRVPFASG